MDMHGDECSGECNHTRVCLMYAAPLRTSSKVHKKSPGQGRMGKPKPTRASMVMVAPPEIPRNAQQGKVKAAPNAMGRKTSQRGQEQYRGRSPKAPTSGLNEGTAV